MVTDATYFAVKKDIDTHTPIYALAQGLDGRGWGLLERITTLSDSCASPFESYLRRMVFVTFVKRNDSPVITEAKIKRFEQRMMLYSKRTYNKYVDSYCVAPTDFFDAEWFLRIVKKLTDNAGCYLLAVYD